MSAASLVGTVQMLRTGELYQPTSPDPRSQIGFLSMPDSYFQEVAERCGRRAQEAIASGEVITQLPHWDDDQRAAPAAVLRSALFGVIRRGARRAVEQETLASWAGTEIRYTGFRLDQADLDCWLQVLHLARKFPLGQDVRFTARGFLRDIGRKGDGNTLRWLRRSLGRMQACGVCIRTPDGREYQGPLISEFFVHEESGRYVVRINPLVAQLFDEAFVKVSKERRGLLRSSLARWLQGYVQSQRASNESPHRIGLARLQALCGSAAQHREFRRLLRNAMNELHQHGVISRWRITDADALEFVRP